LAREKNSQKETLVHSKNQAPPSLPLNIRFMGPTEAAEAKWSPSSAWLDLIQRIELELEEKILKYKFSINEQPQLEWTWQDEPSRGGMECTILAHIGTSSNALSIQNKRHLHWKALEHILSMNNEIEFATAAHNLLRKMDARDTNQQAHKNRAISILASPQAARKKRFTKLDLAIMLSPQKASIGPTHVYNKGEGEDQKPPSTDLSRLPGSISQPAARNRLTYD
jgi:hypothetical protein